MVNEYHLCIICGNPYRTGGLRVVCSNPNCLTEYLESLKEDE